MITLIDRPITQINFFCRADVLWVLSRVVCCGGAEVNLTAQYPQPDPQLITHPHNDTEMAITPAYFVIQNLRFEIYEQTADSAATTAMLIKTVGFHPTAVYPRKMYTSVNETASETTMQ